MDIAELLYNVWLLFYVMQFMSTAYLIQFVGSHYFRQFMSLGDYWILMQLMYWIQCMFCSLCALQFLVQSMCTAVNVAIYRCISNLISVMQVINLNRAG
jgi:hypothetical protein